MDLLSLSLSSSSSTFPRRGFNGPTPSLIPTLSTPLTKPPPILSLSSSRKTPFSSFVTHSSNTYIPVLSGPQTQAVSGAQSEVMDLLFEERILFLGSNIDDVVADCIVGQLLLLDAEDPTKDIRLFIQSQGGSMSSTLAIYDVLQLVRADVSTIALGITSSTASIILGGGTKGKRLAMPNARIMMHQPHGGVNGKFHDVKNQAREVMLSKENIVSIISSFTGRTSEQVEKDIDRDYYMSPIEAVEYGIIDGIIDRDTIIPLAPLPERVKPSQTFAEISKDAMKYLMPNDSHDGIF